MKKKLYILSMIPLMMLACVYSSTAQGGNVPTIVAATFQALTAAAPAGAQVSFQNVNFVVPSGLASGASPESRPATDEQSGGPWEAAPAHLTFTLDGYTTLPNDPQKPMIYVYPAQDYAAANNGAKQSLQKLQAILASPSAPLKNESLPWVPFYNAGQNYAARVKILNFNSGSGVSMVTGYGQFPGPVIKTGQIYHFEGLTSDGRYYIIAILPITVPLASTADNPSADGVTYPDFATADQSAFDAYYQAISDKLNAATPDSFQPSLTQLDALLQSITVTAQ